MKVNERRVQVKGDLGGERVALGIDESALSHIMDVLTNLYSDKVLAVIREYSTNALDSHIEAGVTRPIELKLPTMYDPVFQIEDFGVGLSYDDLTEIYSQYGASTKRGTDTQVGMLGLGCKSALTYTNQFTLDCVKDGERTVAMISRSEDGSAGMEIVDRTKVSRGNGVKVKVPVHNANDFTNKVNEFFSYWNPGTVLINGNQPKYMDIDTKIDDGLFMVNGHGDDVVVMGNVPYPVSKPLLSTGYGKRIIAYVPIGAVDFTPSRESLHYTGRTDTTLEKIRKNALRLAQQLADKEISGAKNGWTAAEAISRWSSVFPGVPFTWRGETLRNNKLNPATWGQPDDFVSPWVLRINSLDATKNFTMYARDAGHYLFVTGFKLKSLGRGHRLRAEKYIETNKVAGVNSVVFCDERFGGVWTEDCPQVTFEELKKIKIPRQSNRSGGGNEPTYYVRKSGKGEWVTDIPSDGRVIYYSGAEDYYADYVKQAFPDDYLLEVGKNRWDKLKRENDNVVHIADVIKTEQQELLDKLTMRDKLEAAGRWKYDVLTSLNASRVADPELAELCKAAASRSTSPEYKRFTALQLLSNSRSTIDIEKDVQPILQRYPLLNSSVVRNNPTHAYEYIKAFAPKNAGGN